MKNEITKITELLVGKLMFSGYSFRTKIENNTDGNLHVIQMKDVSDDYNGIDKSELIKIQDEKINDKYFLQKGDILFIAKGAKNFAVVYDLDLPKAVAVSAFFVLRPNKKKVIPEYLAWFINQPGTQNYLKGNMAGTYVPNVNKKTVDEIMVKLPNLEMQQKIATIQQLVRREEEIMNEIKEKKKLMVGKILGKVVEADKR